MSSMCQCLLQIRSAERHQWPLDQLHQEQSYKYSANAQGRGEIKPGNVKAMGMKIRFHQPDDIHNPDDDDEYCQGGHAFRVTLDRLGQEDQERDHEMEQE